MVLNRLSSGSMLADGRADFAKLIAQGGDPAGAAEVMQQALELAPDWAAGWFSLGLYALDADLDNIARQAFEKVVELEPDDMFGASLKLAVLKGAAPVTPPSRFVEQVFDDYAARFDMALVEHLYYRVPEMLADMLRQMMPGRVFAHMSDIGCGTGLLGAQLRQQVQFLEGTDLSTNMLTEAGGKNLYDDLFQSDLSLAPDQSGLFGPERQHFRADLVTAGDVAIYLGDLQAGFANVADLLAADGIFAFSVEDAGADTDFCLKPTLRYGHSEAYIRGICARYGFAVEAMERRTLRIEKGEPVDGILFVCRKTG